MTKELKDQIFQEMLKDPDFEKAWDAQAEAYNCLSDLMKDAGIDIKHMQDLVLATSELERCQHHFYRRRLGEFCENVFL